MARRNFTKQRGRDLIRRQGHEGVDGALPLGLFAMRVLSKAEQRKAAVAATSPKTLVTKLIRCTCGHSGRVRIPLARTSGPFKCVACGKRNQC